MGYNVSNETDFGGLFDEGPAGDELLTVLMDPVVTQVCINRHDQIFYWDQRGSKSLRGNFFADRSAYVAWLNNLLHITDAGYKDVDTALTGVIEASFDPAKTSLHGSIHISTKELTKDEPALTVRKQPNESITLDDMLAQDMMSDEMRLFLQQAMHGRLNIVVAGGSGAGKTTMARALSWFIDPDNRVVTIEDIDELRLADRLPNVVGITTYRLRDELGRVIRETTLEDLVSEALRMRPDRIWVGETRGREAYSLIKACISGHDGSITTVHSDNGAQAVRQLVTYVMESGMPEDVAREQVSRAFQLVVHLGREKMGRRVVREITELFPVVEGTQQRVEKLFEYDAKTETFITKGHPSVHMRIAMQRYSVNYDGV
jgi:pilus assembly protein CpaF